MSMTFKMKVQQYGPYGTGPFFLVKIPKSLSKKITRKKFGCPLKAIEALRGLSLDPDVYYGAEVINNDGQILAEVE